MIAHDDADKAPVKPGKLLRLVFKVTDVQARFERARKGGVPILSAPRTAHGIEGLIVALIRDPDGNIVELMQTPAR